MTSIWPWHRHSARLRSASSSEFEGEMLHVSGLAWHATWDRHSAWLLTRQRRHFSERVPSPNGSNILLYSYVHLNSSLNKQGDVPGMHEMKTANAFHVTKSNVTSWDQFLDRGKSCLKIRKSPEYIETKIPNGPILINVSQAVIARLCLVTEPRRFGT